MRLCWAWSLRCVAQMARVASSSARRHATTPRATVVLSVPGADEHDLRRVRHITEHVLHSIAILPRVFGGCGVGDAADP